MQHETLSFPKIEGNKGAVLLRIDCCDEHVIQDSSYISGAILVIQNFYISFEAQYPSSLDHISRNEFGHTLLEQ